MLLVSNRIKVVPFSVRFQMLIEETNNKWPQVTLLGLQMKGVRRTFDDLEVMNDTGFLQRYCEQCRLFDRNRGIRRTMQN